MSENIQLASMPLEHYKSACDIIKEITNSPEVIISGELVEKIKEVYDYDWNKLKGSASGEIISINDMSPIEHEMTIKVSGVEDLTSVKVMKFGKNLCDNVFERGGIDGTKGTDYDTDGIIRMVNYIPLKPNTIYTLLKNNFTYSVIFRFYGANKEYVGYINATGVGEQPFTFTTKENYYYVRLCINGVSGLFDTELQLELGPTVTEYEPYIQPTEYIPDTDGVVSGVTSLYPSTTLMTDTDGAVINVIYNKAIKNVEEVPERIDVIYEEGYIQSNREMWDAITNYNTRTTYEIGFRDWNIEYLSPPYKIIPTHKRTLNQTFSGIPNLKKIEAAFFDFSKKTKGTTSLEGVYYTFYNNLELEEIEDIGLQPEYGYYTSFGNCIKLKKIACIRSDEDTRYNGEVFNYCYELEDVTFEGVIGQNGINLRWSKKLSKKSWQNIISHLSTTTSGLSITGSLASVKKTFETSPGANDGDTSTEWLELQNSRSNWTISLA